MVRLVLALDEAILLGIGRWRSAGVTMLMRLFTRLGDALSWIFAALVLMAAGGDAARTGLRLGIAAGMAALVAQALKRLWRRARPTDGILGFTALAENPDAFSFPSGHAAAAFAVALAMAGLVPGGPAFVGLAFAIGLSRVYLGAHYPLDVATGACIGLLCGGAARMVL
ncbi:MAG TPA: phosphatase PAP2 family protein [Myxococcales bacterium]|nr:phosphatase PAP2 family protein [Myxococcales bacterium]